jgi:branched-chain amino acid transport system permease protein
MGAILGAILVTWLQFELVTIHETPVIGDILLKISHMFFTPQGLPNIQSIVVGGILIAIAIFEPLGMHGIYLRIKRYWKMWPF